MMKHDKINKWLWLRLNANINTRKGYLLYETFGSIDGIYTAGEAELGELEFLKKDDIARLCNKSMDGIEAYRHALDSNGVYVLTPDMPEYPQRLFVDDKPPYLLFVKGQHINLNNYLCIGVVGTRNPTIYGQRITDRLSGEIAKNGAIIVSGMALGVDAIAHRSALKAGMPTVAVLGCGVNIVYPKSHTGLYEAIAKNGMIISEYPLSTAAVRYNFPERNRIIAGISHGLVVTEADIKSGSLITADLAAGMGRDVFAVPGNIDSNTSNGTNYLIKNGAFPVTEAADVTESFFASQQQLIGNTLSDFVLNKPKAAPDDTVAEPEEQISAPPPEEKVKEKPPLIPENASDEDKITAAISAKPLTIDQISYVTGISLTDLGVKLLMMEVGGQIRKTQGIYYTTV